MQAALVRRVAVVAALGGAGLLGAVPAGAAPAAPAAPASATPSAPASAAVPAAPADVTPNWAPVTIPASVQPLAAVSQADATDAAHVWAVGRENTGVVASGVPLLLRSSDAGATWTKVATGLSWRGQLNGVAAVGATDVWAIGSDGNGLAHVIHGNGRTWKDVAFPGQGTSGLTLSRIDAAPGGPAWILGSGPSGSVLLRAGGTAVTAATPPSGTLSALRVAADGSVWIASWVDGGNVPYATIWGGDGTNWFPMPTPDGGFLDDIGQDLLIRSRTDIWVVGCSTCGFRTPGYSFPLILHWDGTSWTSFDTPYFVGSFTSVSGNATGPLYVGGSGGYGPGKPPPTDVTGEGIALKFDGTAFAQTYGTPVADQFPDGLRVVAIPGTTVTLATGTATYAPPDAYQPTNLYYPRIERTTS